MTEQAETRAAAQPERQPILIDQRVALTDDELALIAAGGTMDGDVTIQPSRWIELALKTRHDGVRLCRTPLL